MTLVIGWLDRPGAIDTRIVVAADSGSWREHEVRENRDKIFQRCVRVGGAPQPLIVGVAGIGLVAHELKYRWEPDPLDSSLEDRDQVVAIAASMREHLRQPEIWDTIAHEDGRGMDANVLLAWAGSLWEVGEDFVVLRVADSRGWAVMGSAADCAAGAMLALDLMQSTLSGEERLLQVLELCSLHHTEIRSPWNLLEL